MSLPSSSYETLALEEVIKTLYRWLGNATKESYKLKLQDMITSLERIDAQVAKDTTILFSQIWNYIYEKLNTARDVYKANGVVVYIPTGIEDYTEKPFVVVANPLQDNYHVPNSIEVYVTLRNKDGMAETDDVLAINID